MGKYFPPSLQARGASIKGGYAPSNYNTSGNTEIFFNMPAQNDVEALFGLDGSNGGHIQFTLKTKSNNTTALNIAYTPDYVTIYFNAKSNYSPLGSPISGKMTQILYHGSDLYSLMFSNILYKNPHNGLEIGPLADNDYTIQMRFGDKDLSAANQWSPYPAEVNGLQLNFTGFANWRANTVAHSELGEWSNTQVFYAYGPYTATLTANVNKWLPTFTFEYKTAYKDNITNIEVRCQYVLPSGEVRIDSESFSGDLGRPGYFKITRSVNVAPTDTLYVQVIPITDHNTIVSEVIYTPSNPNNNGIIFGPCPYGIHPGGKIDDGDPTLPIGTIGKEPLLVSEERKDGVVAKRIISPVVSGIDSPFTLNIYRFDYLTREAVLIASGIDLSSGANPYIFKDYCVEMGTQYQYAGVIQNSLGEENLMLWEMFSPFASGSKPYGELDKLEFSVLTSKNAQLRFQGNPSVSNFKQEVSESFQTTIGSEYPFYSRVGKSSYRTLSFSGVVSINFDFTSLFLELDSANPSYEKRGLLWEKKLIVPIEKVYEQQEISLNRRRFSLNNPFIASTPESKNLITSYALDDPAGPKDGPVHFVESIEYNEAMSGPATVYDERLLASRKKKYNTEQSSDMIYLERRFREKAMSWLSDGKPKLFRSETEGNMIIIASGVSFTPLQGSQRMVYTAQMMLTEIAEYNLTNLLKYNLLPCEIIADVEPIDIEHFGDHDPNYSDGILRFPDSDSYDIAAVQNGQSIAPMLIAYEQGLRVTGGKPPYTFQIPEIPDPAINLHWEQLDRNGIPCLRIYGHPKSNLAPRIFTVKAIDSFGTAVQIHLQFGGTSASGSAFTIDAIASVTYNGSSQTPAIIVRENGTPVAISPADIVYSNNINAGIATVTVTLSTGGVLMKSFNILQAAIVATKGSLSVSKIYDGTVSTTGAVIAGVPSTDVPLGSMNILVKLGQFYDKNAGAGKSLTVGLTLQGANASNYILSPASAFWNVGLVTKKSITVAPKSGQQRIYGTADPILAYTVTPAIHTGDSIGGALSRAPGNNIGDYAIDIGTINAGANYNTTFTSGVLFTITRAPAPPIQWPQSNQIIYGQPLSAAMSPTTNAFGTFNWDSPTTVPTVSNSGYPVTFTPFDTVNYNWTIPLTQIVTVSVSQKQLILNGVSGVNRVYDRTTSVNIDEGTLSGVVGSDVVSAVTGPATVANKSAGNEKAVSFALSLSGPAASNYTVILGNTVSVDIAAKLVTIVSATGLDRPYNGFNTVSVEVIIDGIILGDNVQTDYITVGEIASSMPANNVPVIAAISLTGSDKNNYIVPPIVATVNITKASQAAPLTPTLVATAAVSIVVVTDSAQEYSRDGGATWQNSGIFTGLSPLTVYLIIGRYKETAIASASPVSSPRIVTTDALTIVYTVEGFDGTYDGQEHGATYTLEPSATIRFSLDGGATYTSATSPMYKNLGTYTIFYKIAKAGAGDIVGAVSVSIAALRISVVADNKNKILSQADPVFTYTYDPALGSGDNFTGALTREAGEDAGNYQILQGTLNLSSNYVILYLPGTLNIGGALITITPVAGQGKVYQDANPASIDYTFSPALQPGDNFTGSLSRAPGEDAGSYPITLWTLSLPSSYSIVLVPQVFTIAKKPVTITADPLSKIFGMTDPPLTYVVSPPVTGGSLVGAPSRAAGEDVGTYPITQGTLDNPNYTIAFSGNLLTIMKAPINRTYDPYVGDHEYTGSPITPTIELIDTLTSVILVQDVDYTLSYVDNIAVGKATIIVAGIGNYQGSMSFAFQVLVVIVKLTAEPIGDITYTGSLITPAPVVKDGDTILVPDIEYTLSYSNNLNVGTGQITIFGEGPYFGNSIKVYFNIIKAHYVPVITNISEFRRVFSPVGAPPTPVVSSNPENGLEKPRYAVKATGPFAFPAPTNVGTYFVKVLIDATANYLETQTPSITFTITPLGVTFTDYSAPSGLVIDYDGYAHEPGVPLVSGVTLVKDTDYTISPNSSAVDAGDYEWTYTGIRNYVGSSGTFLLTINKLPVWIQLLGDINKSYGSPEADVFFEYNSTPLAGSDYLTGEPGRVAGEDAGDYPLTLGTLTGGNNYSLTIAESSVKMFTIDPRNIQECDPSWTKGDLGDLLFSYTGSPIEPIAEVWEPTAPIPIIGVDAEYSYLNNVELGIAICSLDSIGPNFTESAKHYFEIV